jgi:hypothetical protein
VTGGEIGGGVPLDQAGGGELDHGGLESPDEPDHGGGVDSGEPGRRGELDHGGARQPVAEGGGGVGSGSGSGSYGSPQPGWLTL